MLAYILCFIASSLSAIFAALAGIFAGAGIANKTPKDMTDPLAMSLTIGGIGVAVLIFVLYGVGAYLRYRQYDVAWLPWALMLSGIPLLIVFVAVVFTNLPK